MTIQHIPLESILPNPWQTRERPDPEHIQELALDIKANTLLQEPKGRPHATLKDKYELAFGHNRLAAYKLLHEENPLTHRTIPIDVQPLSDRQMSDWAAAENGARKDLNPIEIGRAIQRRMQDFSLDKLEAAAPFHIVSRPGVDNVLALLTLPKDVQALASQHQIPQRAARALVPLTRWRPDLVSKIAARAIAEQPDVEHRAEAVDNQISIALEQNAQTLADHARPWPLEWPAKPFAISDNDQTKGEPAEIPACRGCKFAIARGTQAHCLRQGCFNAKGRAWIRAELTMASEKLGIPVAKAGEALSDVYAGSYYPEDGRKAAKAIRAKLPSLRLVANPNWSRAQNLIDITGSRSVMLATVDRAAVTKYLNESKGQPAPKAKPANESPAAAERRKVAEVELREERALDRMAYNRSKADVLWLVEHTALLIAERTVGAGGLLLFAIDGHKGSFFGNTTEEMRAAYDAIAQRGGIDKLGHGYGNGKSGWKDALAIRTPEAEQLRRQYLAYIKIARDVASGFNPTNVYGNLARALKTCETVATETFGIALPAKWDQMPIHHTPINCWTCGRFSSSGSGQLNQADLRDGWRETWETANGQPAENAALQTVLCPSHAYFQSPGKGYGYPGATQQQKALSDYARAVSALAKLTPAARAVAAARANLVKPEAPAKPASAPRLAIHMQLAAPKAKPAPKPAPKPKARTTARIIREMRAAAKARTRPAAKKAARKAKRK